MASPSVGIDLSKLTSTRACLLHATWALQQQFAGTEMEDIWARQYCGNWRPFGCTITGSYSLQGGFITSTRPGHAIPIHWV